MNLPVSDLKEDLGTLKDLSVKLSEQFSSRDDLIRILQEVMEEDEIIFIEGFTPAFNDGDPCEYMFDFYIYKIPSDKTRVEFDNGAFSLDYAAKAAADAAQDDDCEDIYYVLQNNIFKWKSSGGKNMSFLIIDTLFKHSKIMESCISSNQVIICKNEVRTRRYKPY